MSDERKKHGSDELAAPTGEPDFTQEQKLFVRGEWFRVVFTPRDGVYGFGVWRILRRNPPPGHHTELAELEPAPREIIEMFGLGPENRLFISERDRFGEKEEIVALIRAVAVAAGLPMTLHSVKGDW